MPLIPGLGIELKCKCCPEMGYAILRWEITPMRTEGTFAAIGFALVTLGIAAACLPARGMTLNPVQARARRLLRLPSRGW
jgi:hypothetical protein